MQENVHEKIGCVREAMHRLLDYLECDECQGSAKYLEVLDRTHDSLKGIGDLMRKNEHPVAKVGIAVFGLENRIIKEFERRD